MGGCGHFVSRCRTSGLRVFAEPRVAEALIWLVQMTRGSPFARCWSTAPEVASYRRQGPHPPRPSGPNQGTCRGRVRRLIQPPNASAAGSLIGPGRSWRVRSLAAIGRDFRRRRPAPSTGTASRHLDQPNQSLRHSRLSEHPQTGSTAPADKVTTPALLPPMTQPVEVRWKGRRAGARLSPWDIFGGSTLPSVSHRRTGTYEQQEAEARDRKVQREAEGAREEPIHPAWSAD